MIPATTLSLRAARRLALHRAGLLDLPATPPDPPVVGPVERHGDAARPQPLARERAHRDAALAAIRGVGYLQLDTVSIAGARSHALVLLSRLPRFPAGLGEELLVPGEPLFEYWGHEACWLPGELYPAFEMRRREYRVHPWWGDLLNSHRGLADTLLRRIADEGPLRSTGLDDPADERPRGGGAGWWNLKDTKKVATALWSAGEPAIRERRGFQRTYDLTERVIPAAWRARPLTEPDALRVLLLQALAGHGWATTGTLAATWRLRNRGPAIASALRELVDSGQVVACELVDEIGGRQRGWVRPLDLERAGALDDQRLRSDRGVLLSPFDPLLWDRARVRRLFGFDALLEIFKPAPQRQYGYYCLPVLAGERLVARVDLKADRRAGRLTVLAHHREALPAAVARSAEKATAGALARYADAVGLALA